MKRTGPTVVGGERVAVLEAAQLRAFFGSKRKMKMAAHDAPKRRCVLCGGEARGASLCHPCREAYDRFNRRSDGTVLSVIAWAARRARAATADAKRARSLSARLKRAVDALLGVCQTDSYPNYPLHSLECRSDPGPCRCHMRAAYDVLRAEGRSW